ncbi:MAG: hypothetical protein KH409_07410 [Clostridium sp.]|nr:hypothetical protein [Clostridium sp.]
MPRPFLNAKKGIVTCPFICAFRSGRHLFLSGLVAHHGFEAGKDLLALLTEQGQVFCAPAPSGEFVDSIGAGDAMVAGFLAGYMERTSYVDGFRKGIAAGSATVYKQGLATGEEITAIAQRI